MLGAGDLVFRQMGRCSTGQRRRLAIARAFAGRPPVILLDEPYADLDEDGCEGVAEACRAWTSAGGVVMYAAPIAEEGPEPDARVTIADGSLLQEAA